MVLPPGTCTPPSTRVLWILQVFLQSMTHCTPPADRVGAADVAVAPRHTCAGLLSKVRITVALG